MIRRLRLILILILIVVPCRSLADPWDIDSIRQIFSDHVLQPIEGVWEFPGDGATLLIHRSGATEFDIRVLDSPLLSLVPGTVIGTACVTAKNKYYEGSMDTKAIGKKARNLKSRNLVLNVTDNGYLCFKSYRKGYSLSFKRLFYRLFKISIIEYDEYPDGLTGAKRIYPVNQYSDLPICL